MNWKPNKHVPPFKLSRRLWLFCNRYSLCNLSSLDEMPSWATQVLYSYYHLTREGSFND